VPVSPAIGRAALLNALKEELFALESEKAAGTLAPEEYVTVKAALDTVLARALKRNS
jgi:ribosomal protein L29